MGNDDFSKTFMAYFAMWNISPKDPKVAFVKKN